MECLVRDFVTDDANATAHVFFRAVRDGASKVYSVKQCAAWCPEVPNVHDWAERLAGSDTVIAECDGSLVGFMTMTPGGYLDLAFVLPEYMGKGVAGALYAVLECRCRVRGVTKLTTDASELARPFFQRLGWTAGPRKTVMMRGVSLHNYTMTKVIAASIAA